MAKNFLTNIIIGGKLNPTLKASFDAAGKYAEKAANIIQKTNGKLASTVNVLQGKIQSVGQVAKQVAVVGGVIGGAAVLGSKAMIDQASSLEQYRNTLNVVMKDQKKAGETFAWAVKFANSTPFETDEIVQATVKLQSYGLEAQKVMPSIGDMAAAMGKDVDQAVEAIADAQTGELERLKEFGITKAMIVEQANKKLNGIEVVNNTGQITNQKAFNLAMFSLMQERYKGSMDIQSKSWKGLVSTISGVAKLGLAQIAGISQTGEIIPGSAFDIAKQKVGQLADVFTKLQESGKFEELQKKLADLVSKGFDKLSENLPSIIEFGNKIITNAPQIFSSISEGATKVGDLTKRIIELGVYLAQNGPNIIDTVELVGKGFIAWKVITGLASGIQTIISLSQALSILKTQYLLVAAAKAKDKIETLYLMGLYAKDAIIAGAKTLGTWAMVAAQSALNVVTVIGTGIMGAFGAVLAFVTSPIGLVVLAIVALIAIGVLLYKNWDTVSQFLANSWEGIKQGFATGVNWVVDKINWLIEKVNKIPGIEIPLIPKMKGEIPKAASTAESFTQYASGGIARRASIFGEAGPEMAIPLKPKNPRSISLLSQTAKILGVSDDSPKRGGNTFVFAPNISGNSTPEIVSALGITFEEFKAWIRQYKQEEESEAF